MTGIGHTLNIARTALSAQQYGLNVAGHNIANVNTPSYSRQMLGLTSSIPILFGGLVFGSGVQAQEVSQVSSQMLENRLIEQKSNLARFEDAETYVSVVEGYFNVNSESSISNLLSDFWNAWQDLANNPAGFTERGILVEQGQLIAERLNAMNSDLTLMEGTLTEEVEARVIEINNITAEIGAINQEVVRLQATGTANDQVDKRNALLTELAQRLDIHTFTQEDGAINVTTANGFILVNGIDNYELSVISGQVNWEGSYGSTVDITGKITSGKLGGILEIRDEVVAKYRTELDMLASELIWAVNYQHSQGAGLAYYDIPLTGTYTTDASGLLDTLDYGSKIDYTKDFTMWIRDDATSQPAFDSSTVDMGISDAAVTGWTGAAPEASEFKYVFTVVDGGGVDVDGNVVMLDGPGLGVVRTGAGVLAALDNAIANQTISVFGGDPGTQTLTVRDGGDAERSAASIVAGLNNLDGVTARAFENTAVLDIGGLLPPAVSGADPNDLIRFTLHSAGRSADVAFRVGAFDYETRANFQESLNNAVAAINDFGQDLAVEYTGNTAAITSRSGENIGIADFAVQDLAVAILDNFQNLGVNTVVNVSNFANFTNADTADFSITTARGSVTMTHTVTDDTNQTTLATDFENTLIANGAALNAIGVTWARVGGVVTITGDASAGYVDLAALTAGPGGNESFAIAAGGGTSAYPAAGDNTLVFDGSGDLEQYAGDNTVTFTVNATDNITVDLRRVDTTNAAAVAAAFHRGLDTRVTNAYVTLNGTSVTITATDENAADFTFTNGAETVGIDGGFDVTVSGVTDTLTLDGADAVAFTSVVNTDTMLFDGVPLTESGGAGDDSAVKTGTATIILEPGLFIQSNVAGAAGGVFNNPADLPVNLNSSVLTLGGDGGYIGFDPNNRISFYVDGTFVSYIVAPGDDTDIEFAGGLTASLTAALDPHVYSVSRHGTHVSILKNDGTPIELAHFSDDNFGGGTLARLEAPANRLLTANNPSTNSVSSRNFGDQGIIEWEKFTSGGVFTGQRGRITVSDSGPFEVDEGGLSFTISDGDLVAGNTFTLNTDVTGQAAPLDLKARGFANSVNDMYIFTVDPEGGGEIGSDDITITWTNRITYGSFTIKGETPPQTPVIVNVDGMRLQFESGTLFDGDVFTIATDENGTATVHRPSDWHWTMESFADQFNRQTLGVKATVRNEAITFAADTSGFDIADVRFTGSDGFCEQNCTITARNYEVMDRAWPNLRIERNDTLYASTGGWGITEYTNPGYDVELIPMDGFDLDNGFYVSLDGLRAIAVNFNQAVSDNGSLTFSISPDNGVYSYAFSDNGAGDAGLSAALGVNTFFTGDDAMTIGINDVIRQNKGYIAAATIDGRSGEISTGDNTNALAISNVEHTARDMSQWSFESGLDARAGNLSATLGDYLNLMVGSLGIKSQTIQRSREFSEVMVDQIGQLRDSVSAVSLDEEMINIMKFQHAYTVAAKLLTVSDEMLDTIVSIR
ncbi:MAG: flagellar hook-associated protein FlgK [Thermodesulfobacteriota bacterium]